MFAHSGFMLNIFGAEGALSYLALVPRHPPRIAASRRWHQGEQDHCEQGRNQTGQKVLSAKQSLCRQLILLKGEFANEYGDPVAVLTI